MTLNLFLLKSADPLKVEHWSKNLGSIEVTEFRLDPSHSAVWRGQPFIVAGERAEIQGWLEAQDELAAAVLANCSYFWILTDNVEIDHALLPLDRVSVLDWNAEEQQFVRNALSTLERFPRLAGLSNDMRHLREEIVRLGTGRRGPSYPVLILGESGAGKEEVSQSLVAESQLPKTPGLHCLSGASLNLDPGMALTELFGIAPQTASDVKGRPGLLEIYSKGALFIDDFDTAPRNVQEQLLRITATQKGQAAKFRRVGGDVDLETNAWLLFATNADIERMLDVRQLRPDFLYRFEDRVLVIPPLRDRPSDLPSITYYVWSELVKESQASLPEGTVSPLGDRVLLWSSVRYIYSRKLRWEGNVRELAALLRLVASMVRMPQHREHATGALIEQILARGINSKQWFIRVAKSGLLTNAPSARTGRLVAEILANDAAPAAESGLSRSALEIKERLGPRWAELQQLAAQQAPTDAERVLRSFTRYLVHALRSGSTCIPDAMELGGVKETQARKHLMWLAKESTFLSKPKGRKRNSKIFYELGRYLLRGTSEPGS
jgi:DNA-binding NtrC family response regulator